MDGEETAVVITWGQLLEEVECVDGMPPEAAGPIAAMVVTCAGDSWHRRQESPFRRSFQRAASELRKMVVLWREEVRHGRRQPPDPSKAVRGNWPGGGELRFATVPTRDPVWDIVLQAETLIEAMEDEQNLNSLPFGEGALCDEAWSRPPLTRKEWIFFQTVELLRACGVPRDSTNGSSYVIAAHTLNLLGIRQGFVDDAREAGKVAYGKARRKLQRDGDWILKKFDLASGAKEPKALSVYRECAEVFEESDDAEWRIPDEAHELREIYG